MGDIAEALVEAVADCRRQSATVAIVGHGSKSNRQVLGGDTVLCTTAHAGIIDYRPEELVVSARAGTPLAELTQTLAENRQLLPFEPPQFGGRGTLGGAIASGLAGPARPWQGSVRDAVLGVEIINGLGERLRFGGSVMKNVAGYDLSRLMTGAHGTLGVILSASVRVLPSPQAEETWQRPCSTTEANALYRRWARLPLPITATSWLNDTLSVRLSASSSAIASARQTMQLNAPGEAGLWSLLRDHQHDFFATAPRFRRLSLPRGNRFADERALVEWGGDQAWLAESGEHPASVKSTAENGEGGTLVTLFESGHALPIAHPGATKYASRLKQAFDPHGLLNPGLASLVGTGEPASH